MLIASKYEEMYAPEVQDFVFITDNTYTSAEIRSMEKQMLRVMDYSLGTPLCLHFLRRYSRAGEVRFPFPTLIVHKKGAKGKVAKPHCQTVSTVHTGKSLEARLEATSV